MFRESLKPNGVRVAAIGVAAALATALAVSALPPPAQAQGREGAAALGGPVDDRIGDRFAADATAQAMRALETRER